jgi:ABC-type antimicrobial peptide transport system permease subunit
VQSSSSSDTDASLKGLARERLDAIVSGAFALGGLLLASLGLYGLLASMVTERTKEIGRSVVGGGLRLVAVGVAIGLLGSWVLLRSLGTLLFGVTPGDLSTYVMVLVLLMAVAMVACYAPARRAASVEPLVALRHD